MPENNLEIFPVLNGKYLRGVPMVFLKPHEARAVKNHGLWLAQLAERGGLSALHIYAVLTDTPMNLLPSQLTEAHWSGEVMKRVAVFVEKMEKDGELD